MQIWETTAGISLVRLLKRWSRIFLDPVMLQILALTFSHESGQRTPLFGRSVHMLPAIAFNRRVWGIKPVRKRNRPFAFFGMTTAQ